MLRWLGWKNWPVALVGSLDLHIPLLRWCCQWRWLPVVGLLEENGIVPSPFGGDLCGQRFQRFLPPGGGGHWEIFGNGQVSLIFGVPNFCAFSPPLVP